MDVTSTYSNDTGPVRPYSSPAVCGSFRGVVVSPQLGEHVADALATLFFLDGRSNSQERYMQGRMRPRKGRRRSGDPSVIDKSGRRSLHVHTKPRTSTPVGDHPLARGFKHHSDESRTVHPSPCRRPPDVSNSFSAHSTQIQDRGRCCEDRFHHRRSHPLRRAKAKVRLKIVRPTSARQTGAPLRGQSAPRDQRTSEIRRRASSFPQPHPHLTSVRQPAWAS